MKFMLLLTVFGTDSTDLHFAVATGLTAEDCSIRLEEQQTLLEKTFASEDFSLLCETDHVTE